MFIGTSSNPYILIGRDDAPVVGEEELCFASGCVKTVSCYDGCTTYIIGTGKIKIDTVTTTEVTGKMYAKGSDSDNEINGTLLLAAAVGVRVLGQFALSDILTITEFASRRCYVTI